MNIFVFTASNKDAQKHLKDTIENYCHPANPV